MHHHRSMSWGSAEVSDVIERDLFQMKATELVFCKTFVKATVTKIVPKSVYQLNKLKPVTENS